MAMLMTSFRCRASNVLYRRAPIPWLARLSANEEQAILTRRDDDNMSACRASISR